MHLEDLNKNGFKKRYTQQPPWIMGVSYWSAPQHGRDAVLKWVDFDSTAEFPVIMRHSDFMPGTRNIPGFQFEKKFHTLSDQSVTLLGQPSDDDSSTWGTKADSFEVNPENAEPDKLHWLSKHNGAGTPYDTKIPLLYYGPIEGSQENDWTGQGQQTYRALRLTYHDGIVLGFMENPTIDPITCVALPKKNSWQIYGLIDETCDCINGVFMSNKPDEHGVFIAKTAYSYPAKFCFHFRKADRIELVNWIPR